MFQITIRAIQGQSDEMQSTNPTITLWFRILLSCLVYETLAVTVYDCQGKGVTYEVVDLIATEDCRNATNRFGQPEVRKVQVLYSEPTRSIKGLRCRVVVSKLVTSCRPVDWKIYGTMFTVWREPVQISEGQCKQAATTGVYIHHDKDTKTNRQVKITPGSVNGLNIFSHGRADGEGYHKCSENFWSGRVHMKDAYEQTMLEVLVEDVYGSKKDDEGTVTFLGVRHLAEDGTFFDTVEGMVVWNSSRTDAQTSTSQAYLGLADLHKDTTRAGLLGAIVMVENEEEGQFAGLQLRANVIHCARKCHTTQIPGLTVCLYADDEEVPAGYQFRSGLAEDLRGPQTLSQMAYLHLDTNQRVQDRFDLLADHLCKVELAGLRAKMQALAGGDNLYALLDMYGRGHTVQVAGAPWKSRWRSTTR